MTYEEQPGLPEEVIREYSITDTKKAAETACADKSGVYDRNGIVTTEECYLW